VKVNEALETLAKALGIHRNGCNCEACSMKTIDHKREAVRKDLEALKLHLGLKANEGLTAKHLKMLEELDERGLEMMSAMIEAFKTAGAKAAAADEPPATEDDPSAMRQNKGGSGNEPMTVTAAELDKLVSNRVAEGIEKGIDEALRRRDVTAKLTANEANPFSEEELRTLPLSVLEKTEKAIRPADYSGQGGFGSDLGTFAANATDEDDAPLTINRGVLAPPKKDVA